MTSYTEQIRDLWTSNEVKNLSDVLREILHLLEAAKNKDESIPLELELEIILAANYSFDYGGQLDEAKRIFSLLDRLDPNDDRIDKNKMYRLICTAASAFLTTLTSDAHGGSTNAYKLILWDDVSSDEPLSGLLRQMIDQMLEFISTGSFRQWYLEMISYIITYIVLLDLLGEGEEVQNEVRQILHPIFSSERTSDELELLAKWQGEWLQKSDYLRFIVLMMHDTSVSEEVWLDKAQSLTGLNR